MGSENDATNDTEERPGHLLARRGAVASITLNRPDKMNPLDRATIAGLIETVAEIEAEPAVRVVSITGAGKAFSAGGDLEGYRSLYRDPPAFERFLEDFYSLNRRIEESTKIYVAIVNGACVAGGLELMLACDIVIAAEGAKIGDGHVNFGQLPGAGSSQRLARIVGPLKARYLIMTGRIITGREAEALGLVTLAAPAAKLAETAEALIAELVTKSPAGLRGAKYLISEGLKHSLDEGLRLELAFVHNYATTEPDAMEGLDAFRDKRAPAYRA
ncbi:enoyl-CoA hydratase/isomerase family protein [Oceanibacterium hippocampi]|uniref:Putative enoyl-CoA hydratase echA8 n=1 Tax=Oceanibacterium hippocampi TaxID=745714 RepID=A0A1Y5TSW0_9PROT|nr:enoyl-CoA hydratase/isomerase family protein [Oceanibacterium hippocampi]SLN70642.1 putative enoyl-CoA hydratase echA8 [Oceanibacterium hippocampi]